MKILIFSAALGLSAVAVTGCTATTAGGGEYSAYATSTGQRGTEDTPATIKGFRAIDEREFAILKKSVLFTDDDVRYLRMSRSVLEPHADELLDVWYGFVGANDHLLRYFSHARTGEPDARYLEQVRGRFRQWVLDTADADFDQAWLNRQLEYGLRHHRLKKNTTDGVDAAEHIHFRHLVALHYPITTTMKPFLAKGGHNQKDVDGMYEAWRKTVLMTAILWSQPYIEPQDF